MIPSKKLPFPQYNCRSAGHLLQKEKLNLSLVSKKVATKTK
jgi:hypothetical protein